jgi:hypothetical protein
MFGDVSSVLSDSLRVRWNKVRASLIIEHADKAEGELPQIEIRSETLDEMTFSQVTAFIGERIALLIPAMRERYINKETGMVEIDR